MVIDITFIRSLIMVTTTLYHQSLLNLAYDKIYLYGHLV